MLRLKPATGKRDHHTILKQLERPGTRDIYRLRRLLNRQQVSGIFATYAGYLNLSGLDGMLTFPLKHSKPTVFILITNRIVPMPITSNTIHHWEIKPGTPAALYRMEQIADPVRSELMWRTTKLELPTDNRIPPEAIIIIAKPTSIEVSTKDIVAQQGPHFILPDIQVKESINLLGNALYAVNLFHFFKPVPFAHKQTTTTHTKQIK